jgi:uncharacterized RDD family membrane protein YckC
MTENSERLNAQPLDDEPQDSNRPPAEGSEAAVAETAQAGTPASHTIWREPGTADEGWHLDSSSTEQDSASSQADDVPGPARGRGTSGEKLTRVTLGSALIALDTVNERLDRLDDAEGQQPAGRRSLEDVLVPMSEWQEQFGVAADRPMRHLVLGMMIDARSRAGATARFLNGIGNSMAGAIKFLLQPVRSRRVFRPVRQGFGKAVDRGDSQVERWRAMGRAEDARSRALAETALSSAAGETMDELVTNERVEVFIQEIIEAQTVGIVDEIIEEIRERSVSSDNFFERPVRRLFRRPERAQLPEPEFDPRLVRPFARRSHPIPEASLLGNYAGFVSRLFALIIDVSLIVIVLALGSSLLTTAVDVLGLREWFDSSIGSSGLFTGIFAVVNGLAIVVGYLVLFWLLTGQTLGMMLLGLRVVSRAGGRVTFVRAILRIIGYFLLPGVFFFGFLWILGDDRRQAWHDKLAGTYVVYAWDARPDETFLTYGMYMDD